MKIFFSHPAGVIAGILLCSLVAALAQADDPSPKVFVGAGGGGGGSSGSETTVAVPSKQQFLFRTVATDDFHPGSKEVPWLGVGVAESPEPLSAQLDLKPGEGLVVTFVASNSPAAEAGLQKNDVLVGLDGQMLVYPIQLRKLVQMHADGDTVKIEFYHAGKRQSATAKLRKHEFSESTFDRDGEPGPGYPRVFTLSPPEMLGRDKGNFTVQVQQATDQAKRAMEQAQRAVEDALRQSLNGTDGLNRKLALLQKKLGSLADGGMDFHNDATVVVKNDGESVRTIVKKDDTGTYVIVADPAKHLTAHDSNDKLLFDGPIQTQEQQQHVPKEVWGKVQPMVDQLNQAPAIPEKPSLQQNSQEE